MRINDRTLRIDFYELDRARILKTIAAVRFVLTARLKCIIITLLPIVIIFRLLRIYEGNRKNGYSHRKGITSLRFAIR